MAVEPLELSVTEQPYKALFVLAEVGDIETRQSIFGSEQFKLEILSNGEREKMKEEKN